MLPHCWILVPRSVPFGVSKFPQLSRSAEFDLDVAYIYVICAQHTSLFFGLLCLCMQHICCKVFLLSSIGQFDVMLSRQNYPSIRYTYSLADILLYASAWLYSLCSTYDEQENRGSSALHVVHSWMNGQIE